MLITHRGRRSGKIRQTAVMVLRYDSPSKAAYVCAVSKRADWYRNIQASPAVQVAIGRARYQPSQRFLSTKDIAELLAWSRRHHPSQARMQRLFFNWPETASEVELRAFSESLGGVVFQPATD